MRLRGFVQQLRNPLDRLRRLRAAVGYATRLALRCEGTGSSSPRSPRSASSSSRSFSPASPTRARARSRRGSGLVRSARASPTGAPRWRSSSTCRRARSLPRRCRRAWTRPALPRRSSSRSSRTSALPDLETGDEVEQALDDAAEGLNASYESLSLAALEALDAQTPAEFLQAVAGLGDDLQQLVAQAAETIAALESASLFGQASAELEQAFAEADSCQELNEQTSLKNLLSRRVARRRRRIRALRSFHDFPHRVHRPNGHRPLGPAPGEEHVCAQPRGTGVPQDVQPAPRSPAASSTRTGHARGSDRGDARPALRPLRPAQQVGASLARGVPRALDLVDRGRVARGRARDTACALVLVLPVAAPCGPQCRSPRTSGSSS